MNMAISISIIYPSICHIYTYQYHMHIYICALVIFLCWVFAFFWEITIDGLVISSSSHLLILLEFSRCQRGQKWDIMWWEKKWFNVQSFFFLKECDFTSAQVKVHLVLILSTPLAHPSWESQLPESLYHSVCVQFSLPHSCIMKWRGPGPAFKMWPVSYPVLWKDKCICVFLVQQESNCSHFELC